MKLTAKQLDKLREAFRLSPREAEMVALICAGTTDNRALARAMGLTVGSAKVLLHGLYAKTARSDKAQLVLLCLEVAHPDILR